METRNRGNEAPGERAHRSHSARASGHTDLYRKTYREARGAFLGPKISAPIVPMSHHD